MALTAEFEQLSEPLLGRWIIRITISGGEFLHRAARLTARVGGAPVEALQVSPSGDSAAGLLAREPAAGDHLVMGYEDYPELFDTGIEYQPPQ